VAGLGGAVALGVIRCGVPTPIDALSY